MKRVEDGTPVGERGGDDQEGNESSGAPAESEREMLPSTKFAKVEKSLAALGFFTPSSRRVRTGKVKRISFTREVDGKKVEVSAEIVPSAISGLPITADQDKYLALQELITGIMQRDGKVANPIRFKSADLIRLLQNDTDAGKHYREISEWLDCMTSTTIISKGAVYSAGQKRYITDRFHVFDRSVSVGKELEDGTVADANMVWLSPWQLDNINHNYLLPIDLQSYRQLKNHIAKALVLHLQIWLFASHKVGSFEKRYEELCEILDITVHRAPSLILRQLRPSLDELVAHGYLQKWRIEKTSDLKTYKAVLFHGEKFHRDRRKRIEAKKLERGESVIVAESRPLDDDPLPPEFGRLEPQDREVTAPRFKASEKARETDRSNKLPQLVPAVEAGTMAPIVAEVPVDGELLKTLMDRGITSETARELLLQLKPDQHILDQLEWGEHHVRMNPGKFTNPAGFYIYLIRENVTVPEEFETSRKRAAREAAEHRRRETERLEREYAGYKRSEVDRYVAAHPTEFAAAERNHIDKLAERYGNSFPPEMIRRIARTDALLEIGKKATFLSFDEFVRAEEAIAAAQLATEPSAGADAAQPAGGAAESSTELEGTMELASQKPDASGAPESLPDVDSNTGSEAHL
jgi:hypothetical protein